MESPTTRTADAPQKIDWSEREFAEVRPGIFGATVHTPQLTATLYRYGAGSSWEEHDHPQDQITTVLEGAIDFVVAGEPVHLDAGQLATLPGNTPHSATAPQDGSGAVTLNVFTHRESPPRCLIAMDRGVAVAVSDWLGLEGQRALIAGGGGTIGRALVDGFLGAGATVAVVDLNDAAMAGLDDRVAVRQAADLSDAAASRAAVARVRDVLGGLDVLVHCVGINDRKPIEDYTAIEWDRIIGVNLTSAFHSGAEAAVGMREQRHMETEALLARPE